MNVINILLTIISISSLVLFSVMIQVSFYQKTKEMFVPNIAIGLLRGIGSAMLVVLLLLYLREWGKINSKSAILMALKYTVFPYSCIFWSLGYSYSDVFGSGVLMSLVTVMYIIWLFCINKWIHWSEHAIPPGNDMHLLFTTYPPKNRFDMFIFDLTILSVLYLPFIAKFEIGL